jgi:ParB-like chromosome segregation protein Spo0J/16S rRNA G966 N2-methylase RsmD
MAAVATQMVTLADGMTFELPYASLFDDLPEDEFQALVEDIRANGVVVPVHVHRDPSGADLVIDGQHRLRACKILGITSDKIPIDWCYLHDPRELLNRAIALNTHRRQLARETRVKMVAMLRENGLSYATIAQQLGIGESTVRRDAGCSTPPFGGVEQILGKDGRRRAAVASTPAQVAERRKKVAALAAAGHTIREIADRLRVAVGTVAADFAAAAAAIEEAEETRAAEEARVEQRRRIAQERRELEEKWQAERAELDAKKDAEEAERKATSQKLGLTTTKTEAGHWEVHDAEGVLQGRIVPENQGWVHAFIILCEESGRAAEFRLWDSHKDTFSSVKNALVAFEQALSNPEEARMMSLKRGRFALPEVGPARDEEAIEAWSEECDEEDQPVEARVHPFNELPLAKGEFRIHTDLITGTLWVLGSRARGEGRSAGYHGNFVPQIVDQVLRRFTKRGDVVLDLFLGGATTMVEAVRLGRHCLGVDLKEEAVDAAWKLLERLPNPMGVEVALETLDSSGSTVLSWAKRQLEMLGKAAADHVILHPPYHRIIEFSNDPRDLSQCAGVEDFLAAFTLVARNAAKLVAPGRFITLVIGNIPEPDGPGTCPLAALCMMELRKISGLALWAENVKDIQGNQQAEKDDGLWTWRCLNLGIQKFKHEYVYFFKRLK